MKKKIFIILVVLAIVLSAGITFLNRVILPRKVKALIVSGIEDATQKKVTLQSLKLNIFKGLVLRNLNVYEGTKTILSLKVASCTFLILPLFKKQLIIPAMRFESPVIFLERRPDNSLNILDFLTGKPVSAAKNNFSILVYKISVTDAHIDFQDDTVTPIFTKQIDNLSLFLSLSLPAKAKFKLECEIPDDLLIRISSSGEYNLLQKELAAKIIVRDLSPQGFFSYYKNFGVSIPAGKIDALINLRFKDEFLNADLEAQTKELAIAKDKIIAKLNSTTKVNFKYSLKDKQLNGSLDIVDAKLKLEKIGPIFENINGKLEFSPNQLMWSGLSFKYLNTEYKTSGTLADFKAPAVTAELSSKDLRLESAFAVNGKFIKFSKFKGQYINSEFSLAGDIDVTGPSRINADIRAGLKINLDDLKEPLKNFKERLEQIKPSGVLQVDGNLAGNINDIKSCAIEAEVSGNSISAYGLKSGDFLISYSQQNGIADMKVIRMSLYDGVIDVAGSINLASSNLPYWVNFGIQGVKIEKLKMDTPGKDKDIAGTIQAQAKINGFSNDLAKLSGQGRLIITEGKLWELNLFKGLGRLVFAKDFASIVFKEGSSDFFIQDKSIFTDNLSMKSEFVDLSGPLKIGFDNSIDASLNVRVDDKMVPLAGTFKDLTTAIIGQAGRFGVIKINGTLKEPKYKFQSVAFDILKALKEAFFGE